MRAVRPGAAGGATAGGSSSARTMGVADAGASMAKFECKRKLVRTLSPDLNVGFVNAARKLLQKLNRNGSCACQTKPGTQSSRAMYETAPPQSANSPPSSRHVRRAKNEVSTSAFDCSPPGWPVPVRAQHARLAKGSRGWGQASRSRRVVGARARAIASLAPIDRGHLVGHTRSMPISWQCSCVRPPHWPSLRASPPRGHAATAGLWPRTTSRSFGARGWVREGFAEFLWCSCAPHI